MKKIMVKSTFILVLSIVLFSLFPSAVFAHSENDHVVHDYKVTKEQTPLSPFVGEKVTVSFLLTDEKGQPAKLLAGNLVVKKLKIKQYTDRTSEQEEEVIETFPAKTDEKGNVSLSYTFPQEGLYDVEFIWGSDPEEDSTGLEIMAREPSSYFLPQELQKRIGLFIGIALGGIIVGSFGTFIILTARLHKRK